MKLPICFMRRDELERLKKSDRELKLKRATVPIGAICYDIMNHWASPARYNILCDSDCAIVFYSDDTAKTISLNTGCDGFGGNLRYIWSCNEFLSFKSREAALEWLKAGGWRCVKQDLK